MKNVLKLTLAVAMMLVASSSFAQKFGRINMQELIMAMPETKEMQTNMEAYAKDLQDNLESISVEFNNKLQDYQKNATTLSDAVRQLREKELQELTNRREEFSQVAQQDIQKKQAELLEPIIAKAKEAVSKASKAGMYTAVFDTSVGSLAYMDETALTDLLGIVKKGLGITDAPAAAPAKAPVKAPAKTPAK